MDNKKQISDIINIFEVELNEIKVKVQKIDILFTLMKTLLTNNDITNQNRNLCTATFGELNNDINGSINVNTQNLNEVNIFELISKQIEQSKKQTESENLSSSRAKSIQLDSLDKLGNDLKLVLKHSNYLSSNLENFDEKKNEINLEVEIDKNEKDDKSLVSSNNKVLDLNENDYEQDDFKSIEIVIDQNNGSDLENDKKEEEIDEISSDMSTQSTVNMKPYLKFMRKLQKKGIKLLNLKSNNVLNLHTENKLQLDLDQLLPLTEDNQKNQSNIYNIDLDENLNPEEYNEQVILLMNKFDGPNKVLGKKKNKLQFS